MTDAREMRNLLPELDVRAILVAHGEQGHRFLCSQVAALRRNGRFALAEELQRRINTSAGVLEIE